MKADTREYGKNGDALSELLQDPQRNHRHDLWLWLHLYRHEEARLDPESCNGSTMRDEIARALESLNFSQTHISRERDRFLLPDKTLEWIGQDERQYRWVLREIEHLTDRPLSRRLVHLIGRDRLIAMIDLWDIDLAEKSQEVERLHQDWLRHKAKDSEFEWFADKKDGEKRCVCAWEWLEKNYESPPFRLRQTPISNHQELLIFFDYEDIGRTERAAMIREIKRRWSRKQFDERTADKKQVNVLLSKTVITQLDKLAKAHDLKRAQIIENLVRMEAETGVYLSTPSS